MRLKPRPLVAGDTIAVIAPCSPFRPQYLQAGIHWLERQGYRVRHRPDIAETWRYLAGSDPRRTEELLDALNDPEVGAVICARGGYGAARLLPALMTCRRPSRPIAFVGFSDVTMLHLWLGQQWNWVTLHGPMVGTTWAGQGLDAQSAAALLYLLSENGPMSPLQGGTSLVAGEAEGYLVGGNLSLLASSVGTPVQADFKDAIVLLEDIGEAPYRIDRMLTQLLLAGVFEGARGIVLGDFTDCEAPSDADWTATDVLLERLAPLGIPVAAGFPCGHAERNIAVPFGVRVRLDANRPSLTFLEAATAG